MSQLLPDCINDILEYLEGDNITLCSCLLVNRLWCEFAVRILWRDFRYYCNIRTLIACLPFESNEILLENGIIISTPTSKSPIFNYASFCKVLSVKRLGYNIEKLLQQSISSQNFNNCRIIVEQEIHKLLMYQITSLKNLEVLGNSNIILTTYPGAENCLKNLSELSCYSNSCPEFFYHLSQICHNLQSLCITFDDFVPNGLSDLISAQKNLKYLDFSTRYYTYCEKFKDIISSLTKISKSLVKFTFYSYTYDTSDIPLSFIAKFTNLQEIELIFNHNEDFKELQYVDFPQLQVLKIPNKCPRLDLLINFIEINGGTLKEIYVGDYGGYCDNSLNLAVANFCPNLRKLSVGFRKNELEIMEMVFNNCQYLESVKIWCGGKMLSEGEALDMVVKYSPNSLFELIFYHIYDLKKPELLPEELESSLISWKNRVPSKSISLIIVKSEHSKSFNTNEKNMKIIRKYTKLGTINRFKVTGFSDEVYGVDRCINNYIIY